MFIPMTKIDEEKRLVYGTATQEVKDRSDETMDYDSSKPLFEKWSQDIEKASGGKSLGNVREMHSNKAAGKLTQLTFNDAAKAIEVCAKVVDDDSWNKVKEGVLTGFSIGGSYAKRWRDATGGTRFTAGPAELSLVDLPCCPTATFDVIKASGMVEQREFKIKEDNSLEQEINKTILDDFTKALADKDLAKAFSFEEITNRLQGALNGQIKTPFNCGYFWVKATYPDSVIIAGDIDGDGDKDLYRVAYTMTDDGIVTLGDIQEVKMEFVPAVDEDDPSTMAGLPTTKADEPTDLEKKDYSTEDRKKMSGKGEAESDGSFPIKTAQDVKNAVKDWGRAGSKASDKEHIISRAKAIGAESSLPDGWDGKKAEKAMEDKKVEKDPEKPVEKTIEPQDLEKAGAVHSKATMDHLQKAHHELTQAGAACKCDKCQKMMGKDDSETMTEAAKTVQDTDLHKSIGNDQQLYKLMEGISILQKSFDGLNGEYKVLQKKFTDLENQPMPGGALFQSGSLSMEKSIAGESLKKTASIDSEESAYDFIIANSKDPGMVQDARLQKSNILMKKAMQK